VAEAAGPILVVAWGNPLRGDDGVAWHVVETLRSARLRPDAPPLLLRHAHQLTPELAEPVSRAAGVVFIDACADGVPGEVRCTPLAPGGTDEPVTHTVAPQTILSYAERLYGRAPKAVLVTVCGDSFAHGESLSPAVLRAVPRAARRVRALARAWVGGRAAILAGE